MSAIDRLKERLKRDNELFNLITEYFEEPDKKEASAMQILYSLVAEINTTASKKLAKAFQRKGKSEEEAIRLAVHILSELRDTLGKESTSPHSLLEAGWKKNR